MVVQRQGVSKDVTDLLGDMLGYVIMINEVPEGSSPTAKAQRKAELHDLLRKLQEEAQKVLDTLDRREDGFMMKKRRKYFFESLQWNEKEDGDDARERKKHDALFLHDIFKIVDSHLIVDSPLKSAVFFHQNGGGIQLKEMKILLQAMGAKTLRKGTKLDYMEAMAEAREIAKKECPHLFTEA